jgi:hypothetical protein
MHVEHNEQYDLSEGKWKMTNENIKQFKNLSLL